MRETAIEIEGRVDRALERCFTNRARATTPAATRAKVAKVAPRAAAAAVAPARRTARAS
jgi:hypothetical protein